MENAAPLIELIAVLTHKIAALQAEVTEEESFSDLSLRQIYYLDTIGRLDNPTPTEVARAMALSKPTVSVALEKLAEAGYVRKVQSDEDRRSVHLHLTPRAQRLAALHDGVHARIAAYLLEGLSEAEAAQLAQLAGKIVRHMHAPQS